MVEGQLSVLAFSAAHAKKAMNRNATTKVGLQLVKHEGGQFATF
jgi:hypothetical protein